MFDGYFFSNTYYNKKKKDFRPFGITFISRSGGTWRLRVSSIRAEDEEVNFLTVVITSEFETCRTIPTKRLICGYYVHLDTSTRFKKITYLGRKKQKQKSVYY